MKQPNRYQQELTAEVHDQLAAAGLAIDPGISVQFKVGARVTIEPDEEFETGVFVHWSAHPYIARKAAESFANRRFDDPVHEQLKTISGAMRDAMFLILRSAGFAVDHADEEIMPNALWVTAGPKRD